MYVHTPYSPTLRRAIPFLLPGFLLGPGCVGKREYSHSHTHTVQAQSLQPRKCFSLRPTSSIRRSRIKASAACPGSVSTTVSLALYKYFLVLGRNAVSAAPPIMATFVALRHRASLVYLFL
ncbi:hypothetical protein B0I37DRAFT_35875 [Chaetomium sp. MPI-CAGE-AT-0009]|nr:hypothetical protein B0I37DRAFT_35875 [Chaetomium sp. MPI-CAGE-AT-0009]